MHIAYEKLPGKQVNGYTVFINAASTDSVVGELRQDASTPLPFTINASEQQFEAPAVIDDIVRDFQQYIQHNALMPSGTSSPSLEY